ncbi:MAG: hypothetical protein Q8O64_14580 [Sideroxyarcus sp.]|nr:hypothetical protein [Sideroxyarcus sp.]
MLAHEYRYAMVNRPFGLGTAPKDGYIRSEDRPAKGDEHHDYARNGVAVYNRPLTDAETKNFEMARMVDDQERDAVAEAVTDSLKKYAGGYLEMAANESDQFKQTVYERIKSTAKGYPPSVGDMNKFADMVRDRLQGKPEIAQKMTYQEPAESTLLSKVALPIDESAQTFIARAKVVAIDDHGIAEVHIGDRKKIDSAVVRASFPLDKTGQLSPQGVRYRDTFEEIMSRTKMRPYISLVSGSDVEISDLPLESTESAKTLRIPKEAVKPALGEVKEPWQMTKAEYRSTWDTPEFRKEYPNYKGDQDHGCFVEDAIEAGKPVPEKVLADYPDLNLMQARAERQLETIDVDGYSSVDVHHREDKYVSFSAATKVNGCPYFTNIMLRQNHVGKWVGGTSPRHETFTGKTVRAEARHVLNDKAEVLREAAIGYLSTSKAQDHVEATERASDEGEGLSAPAP